MSTVIVVHALGTDPKSAWYPALSDQLAAEGHHVELVPLPHPDVPERSPWLEAVASTVALADPADTVLVGHSLGGVTVLRLLEEHSGPPFLGAVLVATMAHSVGYQSVAEFFTPAFLWRDIRAAARDFRLLTALDDPVLVPSPMGHVEILVRELGATALVKATGGHFPTWTPDQPPTLDDLPEATALVRAMLADE